MVGRLVEHQHVGLLEEHPDQIGTASLPPGQRRDVGEEQLLGEPQAVGQPAELALDLVAAGQAIPLLERAELGDALVGRRLRERAARPLETLVEDVEAPGREHVGEDARVDPQPLGHGHLGQEPEGPVTLELSART